MIKKTQDKFKHDLPFYKLNYDQKYSYILALTFLILRIPESIILLGAGGTGKSEAVKLL